MSVYIDVQGRRHTHFLYDRLTGRVRYLIEEGISLYRGTANIGVVEFDDQLVADTAKLDPDYRNWQYVQTEGAHALRAMPASEDGEAVNLDLHATKRASLQSMLKYGIDKIRAKYNPDCSHGSEVRDMKLVQALDILVNHSDESQITASDFPLVAAEARARGVTLRDAAMAIESASLEETDMLTKTETIRTIFKREIDQAKDDAEFRRIRENMTFALVNWRD